jgi:hypothetical protein
MSQIIEIVRQINDITKREISVVHAMSSLPEPERTRFWHEQFMPLAAQEHALRQELRVVADGFFGPIDHEPFFLTYKVRRLRLWCDSTNAAILAKSSGSIRLDLVCVIDITFMRNDRTTQTSDRMATVDVHPADETCQPESGDLAEAAAVRNGAAREFGISVAEQRQQ